MESKIVDMFGSELVIGDVVVWSSYDGRLFYGIIKSISTYPTYRGGCTIIKAISSNINNTNKWIKRTVKAEKIAKVQGIGESIIKRYLSDTLKCSIDDYMKAKPYNLGDDIEANTVVRIDTAGTIGASLDAVVPANLKPLTVDIVRDVAEEMMLEAAEQDDTVGILDVRNELRNKGYFADFKGVSALLNTLHEDYMEKENSNLCTINWGKSFEFGTGYVRYYAVKN